VSRLYTIGFTQKTAEQFFTVLEQAGVKTVVDTRLNNRSQLAGFSKADDLAFFLRRIGQIGYRYEPDLAPTQDLLDSYKKDKGTWEAYAAAYLSIIQSRQIGNLFTVAELADSCFLCSEHEPTHCHRRLAAEYFQGIYPEIEIVHLGLGKRLPKRTP
jgi:uncharacterized protein (DUF488 family)